MEKVTHDSIMIGQKSSLAICGNLDCSLITTEPSRLKVYAKEVSSLKIQRIINKQVLCTLFSKVSQFKSYYVLVKIACRMVIAKISAFISSILLSKNG